MARPSVPLAFPTWRELWASLDGVPELLIAADATLRRRMAGNQRILRWSVSGDSEMLAVGIRALRQWAEGKPPKDPTTHPEIARRIQAIVHPVLRAAVWPRWLFLERAFLDASATGDLLFAALVLRTMCEEVQRLRALDLSADQLESLAGSSKAADHERLKLFLSVAWTSLADLPQDMVLDGKDWPTLKLMATAMPRLERARATLNSYVHPNYGSHITALFPERASAARLLLEAVVVLYEAFFALSWAEPPVAGQSIPTGIGTLESWPRSVRRFQSHTLPEVRRTAANPALAEAMKAPALIEWLTAKRDDLVDMLRHPAIAPVVDELPRRSMSDAAGNEVSKFRIWEGARAIDVLRLASARRVEQLLAGEFSSGAPDPSDQISWLRFNALSLQLAILIDQVKAAAFKTQLVRQVAQGNSIGALLCVRSLIEHRALAVWLPKELGISLDALAGNLRAATPLPKIAADVEQPLANFLAAQAKGSKEQHRSWVTVEHGGVRTAWLNLSKIVETAFPGDDQFRTLYALGSAALHGRYGRGRDLMLNSAEVAAQARLTGLLVLERLCNRDEEMNHLSAAVAQSTRLEHAAASGGTSAATTDVMAQQAFGLVGGTLRHGIDYSGEGTAESPFCISTHLQFHKTSHALLEQLGVDVTRCLKVLDQDTTGRLCDRWRSPARDYWFQAPIPRA